MGRTMLDEYRTPRCFWDDAISTACYISNRIFLRSILYLTAFELRFGCKPSVSHFRSFGCKCFILKRENLDKFESHSFDGILLGYTAHGRSYRVYNFETNIVVELCDVTFDETTYYPRDVIECASDKEIEESIFVDEGLQGVDGDEDKPLLPSTSSPEHVPASTLEAEAPQATTSSTAAVEVSRVEREIVSEPVAPSHIQKRHPPQQIIGIQVKQMKQGTFVHQAKYTKDLIKKFNMAELKPVSTSMSSAASLGPDEDGQAMDEREYRSMIDSLMYLTATRPDIQFIVGLCARFQCSSRSSHRTTVQ
jgi:hypothetical protein